ncbi:DUF427 domain-containing protein [Synechococcus sp. RedBA-s]|uniref:DUF427 domain-containing protein n=1 Tax=Synechococcus sp. RedBA-s TaxID=2823741 RepID=UPI0020CC0174|nr:DUF427 domain-containing protein [Synechococcus sp. RedBA-s]MCP9801090.1 DUF427 domain-containing protein [Synechococcus sp. RedBA-s]
MGISQPSSDRQPDRVCDYPRPPALVPSEAWIQVRALGELLADTRRSLMVLETFHPPTPYLPPEDLRLELLQPAAGRSFCEWKGLARYYDVVVGERRLERAVWSYPQPTPAFAAISGWFAVYPALMDGCWLDGEVVIPQPGGFYGGWITSQVEGPFKGDPAHSELI